MGRHSQSGILFLIARPIIKLIYKQDVEKPVKIILLQLEEVEGCMSYRISMDEGKFRTKSACVGAGLAQKHAGFVLGKESFSL